MNVVNTTAVELLSASAILLTAACSRETERVSSATEHAAAAISKESWVDDVR